ncbi:MmgE/PrpD family protein [Gordonia jinghuaiqii]|uniref:MmgE/PrpD family protein n=1 Tax=Gordonia jinghuaiqii TaxID=2758710 RepID=A0A7D7LRR6_9ACTN|nr:MmgE/PrpD family protein [Gordonia jinghuaiqii]MCR5979013.1 MmgE/PrpD family protein [Gordonia jinghuaiqii]QMT01660.1 MmgE/PrpD family protein [Gordonia jinghuaiqii]
MSITDTSTPVATSTTTSLDGATDALVAWVVEATTTELPAAVDHHVRRLLVDYMAAVVPGSTTDVARAVAGHVAATYGGNGATAVGLGRVSAPGAALLNGTSCHSLEVDDGYTPGSVHPSSVSFPAVLAAAEVLGSDTTTTTRGLAVALEVTSRLAAAGHPTTWRNHFHNTPLAGVIGATCGVAVLHGLDADRLHDALGVAASHAGGLFAFLGKSAEVKRVHPGKAARDAIASVELAVAGVTGPRSILETPHGYVDAFADGGFDAGVLLDGLGRDWAVLNSYVKPYPSCRHLHGPIDAVLALRAEHGIGIDDVASAAVRTYTVASHHAAPVVDSLLDAQMSIPFALATALAHDEVGLTEFDGPARQDPRIRELATHVEVVADAQSDSEYPRLRPASVELRLHDGRVVSHRVELPYGEPGNPVSDEEMTAKFVRLAAPVLGADEARELAKDLWAFESLDVIARIDLSVRKQS